MKYLSLLPLLIIIGIVACDEGVPTSDQIANRQQEHLSKQSVQSVGMPAIINFQEKRVLKMILELRDTEKLPTTTYIVDMGGHLHKLCNSIGYGIPYATQYTSPQKMSWIESHGFVVLPQADPNGLFSPASADGTWVLCLNPKTKKMSPLYVEPRIIVSPFEIAQ
jgi:hypothetical protein